MVLNLLIMKSGVSVGALLAGLFQAPSTPPMKLGLWEITTTVTMEMPGMPAQPPRSMKVRSCVTAESWTKSFGKMQQTGDCTLSHQNMTAGHYSFDVSCPSMNATGHSEMNFSDETTGHGTMRMEMNAGGQQMVTSSVWDSHYLGADCGAVTPDKPQIIR